MSRIFSNYLSRHHIINYGNGSKKVKASGEERESQTKNG